MNTLTILEYANIFFAGILAGMEIAIHYGVTRAIEYLAEQTQLRFRQSLTRKLRVLVPAFFVPTALSGIAVTVIDIHAPGFWLRGTAMVALAVWILIRIVGTVPINSAVLDWDADEPPADWKAKIDHAERFHIIGVWAAVVVFVFFLVAAAVHSKN